MQVKTKAVEKAVQLLKAAGVQYAILTEGGRKIGDLDIVKPGEKRVKKQVYGVYQPHYRQHGVDAMQPGDVVVVPYIPGMPKSRVLKNLYSYGYKLFGEGACMAVPNGTGVEIMRVK